MTDEDIIKFFITDKYRVNSNLIRHIDSYPEYKEYLLNRYDDEKCLSNIIWRIYYKQEVRNICPICGAFTPFDKGRVTETGMVYRKYCGSSCSAKSDERKTKYHNTCLDMYGVEHPFKIPEVREKCLTNAWSTETKTKRTETVKREYGCEYTFQSDIIKAKSKETIRKHFGVEHQLHSEAIRKKIIETNKERYGTEWVIKSEYFQEKAKESCIEHFGVDNYFKSQQSIDASHSKEAIEKCIASKRKNKTLNTSKPEDEVYEMLVEQFGFENVKRNYKSDSYPFLCDFYVTSLDLYIECNFHWTHGGHAFDINNQEDIDKVAKLKSRGTKYYDNAVNTWTIRDVKKRTTAKENKLNYIELWNIDEYYTKIENL